MCLEGTGKYARVVRPGVSARGKGGTVTRAERGISRGRKVMAPMGGYGDWEGTVLLSNALGYPMNYNHPSEIMDEIASLTPSFTGVSYAKLDEPGPVPWPCNE